ncbi:hypothetical protein EIN_193220 [Entamoeba invadens IP1]|uniref:Maelstrom domain-containing protein n=1 Tax=Entamoeba invadens IP1 TaxID=370355 RepID=A0A0A1U9G7_ENTIV|nr:hypothetical protein EIN_193220 [Entamoeba invadens IP1]ELP88683.1 hypothetical protein EIN_193220 [Entamoeba invadens IP1]|eukprot:XP_004255454.1 hypothetical protein EIN_193220 [Entamoeba invadens IP1]
MSKPTPQYLKWTDVEPTFLQNFQTSILHFIDFEFANSYNAIPKTNEIGISTVSLSNPAEHDSFHVIIRCKKSDKYTFRIHGINSNSLIYPTPGVGFSQFIDYMSKYSGLKIFVVKDEKVGGGDVKVMNSIFKTSDIQYTILTHHMLISCILHHFNVEFDEFSIKGEVNMFYKHLHVSEKCEYHTKLDKKFHCALSDARNTALTVFASLKALCNELVFHNTELIPFYEVPKFDMSDGSSFVLCFCNTFGTRNSVYEILMEEVTYQNGKLIECEKDEMCFEHFVPPQVKGQAHPEIYEKLTSAYPDVENHNEKAFENVSQYLKDHSGMYLVNFGFVYKETDFDFSEMYLKTKLAMCKILYAQCGGKGKFSDLIFYNKIEELGDAILVSQKEKEKTKEFVCNIHKKTEFEKSCVCEVKEKYLRGLEEFAKHREICEQLGKDMKIFFEEVRKLKEKEKKKWEENKEKKLQISEQKKEEEKKSTFQKEGSKTKEKGQQKTQKRESRKQRKLNREKIELRLLKDLQKGNTDDDINNEEEKSTDKKE